MQVLLSIWTEERPRLMSELRKQQYTVTLFWLQSSGTRNSFWENAKIYVLLYRFCFVLFWIWGKFQSTVPRRGLVFGGRGELSERFCVTILGGLYLEGLIHGGAYFWNFTVFIILVSWFSIFLCERKEKWYVVINYQKKAGQEGKRTPRSSLILYLQLYFCLLISNL